MGLILLSDLVQERKLALVARFDEEGTEGRALLASLLRRNLNMSNTIPPFGYGGMLVIGTGSSWATSLVEWLGERGLSIHLSGPLHGRLLFAPGRSAEGDEGYRAAGITLEEEAMGDREVLLRPAQCWLRPGSAGGKRVVCEILGQTHGGASVDGDRLLLLAWEREGDRELRVGDVVTAHERSLSGFHRGGQARRSGYHTRSWKGQHRPLSCCQGIRR